MDGSIVRPSIRRAAEVSNYTVVLATNQSSVLSELWLLSTALLLSALTSNMERRLIISSALSSLLPGAL